MKVLTLRAVLKTTDEFAVHLVPITHDLPRYVKRANHSKKNLPKNGRRPDIGIVAIPLERAEELLKLEAG